MCEQYWCNVMWVLKRMIDGATTFNFGTTVVMCLLIFLLFTFLLFSSSIIWISVKTKMWTHYSTLHPVYRSHRDSLNCQWGYCIKNLRNSKIHFLFNFISCNDFNKKFWFCCCNKVVSLIIHQPHQKNIIFLTNMFLNSSEYIHWFNFTMTKNQSVSTALI